MEYKEIHKLVNEVGKYADIEGTKLGDTCISLCNLTQNKDYLSDEFYQVLIKELQEQLDNFKMYSRIIKKEYTIKHNYYELEWRE